MINVGMVGFGLSGRYLQAPFFQLNPNFNLKAIVTSQSIPEALFPSTIQSASFDELLTDKSLDLIAICSPSNTHFDYAKRSLLEGKHVLIEKPITATLAEAKELYDLAKEVKKVLYVYQNRRFDGDFMTIKSVIESGLLGEIISYEAHFDRYKPILNPKRWKEEIAPANGILYDLGSHLIDQAIYIFGIPESYSGEVFTQREGSAIDDAFDLKLNFKNIKVYLKSSLMVKHEGPRYIIHGTKGSYIKYGLDVQENHLVSGFWPNNPGFGVENVKGFLKTSFNGLELESQIETFAGNWGLLFENLAQVILTNELQIVKPEEILAQISLIENIKSTK